MKVSGAWKFRLLCMTALLTATLAAGIWWYFSIYTNSPDYSVRIIKNAVAGHDAETIKKYVDMDRILDSSADTVMESLIDNEKVLSPEAKTAIGGITRMFKGPLVESFRELILNYVEKGEWIENTQQDKVRIDTASILGKLGLKRLSYKRTEYVNNDDGGNTAEVGVRLFAEDIGEEYVLNVIFTKEDNGIWQAAALPNLADMIGFIQEKRRLQLREYLVKTQEMTDQHEAVIKIAELKKSDIIAAGNLSSNDTRRQLKKVMEEEVIPAWERWKNELQKIDVPTSAKHLHRLRLKICDLRLKNASFYVKWLDDKQGATAKSANDCIREAGALERELIILTQRIKKQDK